MNLGLGGACASQPWQEQCDVACQSTCQGRQALWPLGAATPAALLLDPPHRQPLSGLELIVLTQPSLQHLDHLCLRSRALCKLVLQKVAQTTAGERGHGLDDHKVRALAAASEACSALMAARRPPLSGFALHVDLRRPPATPAHPFTKGPCSWASPACLAAAPGG